MNILIITNAEWSDSIASGNTLSNLFAGMRNTNISSIYRRNSMPDNNVCEDYYRISAQDILKNMFTHEKIGKHFKYKKIKKEQDDVIALSKERKFINFIHLLGLIKVINFNDTIFNLEWWKNRRFYEYVRTFKPDIVFFCVVNSEPLWKLIQAVKESYPSIKLVSFIVDDIYQNASNVDKKRLKMMVQNSNIVYGITEQLCREYGQRYGRKITLLHKGCNFDELKNGKPRSVIKIIYAGNLLYGRADTLAVLAEQIYKVNQESSIPIKLDVYSGTDIIRSTKEKLNLKGTCELHASMPYEFIKEAMRDSDIVLHVESFEEDVKKTVRLSFSTKITDCMQSGSVLMAIGPSDIASVDFVKKIPGAIVVDDLTKLSSTIRMIPSMHLDDMSKEIREYAEKNFSIYSVQKRLMRDMNNLLVIKE